MVNKDYHKRKISRRLRKNSRIV